jgi:hypothetical protein
LLSPYRSISLVHSRSIPNACHSAGRVSNTALTMTKKDTYSISPSTNCDAMHAHRHVAFIALIRATLSRPRASIDNTYDSITISTSFLSFFNPRNQSALNVYFLTVFKCARQPTSHRCTHTALCINQNGALIHLRSGLQLLRNWRMKSAHSASWFRIWE